jgi:hypothetical protein
LAGLCLLQLRNMAEIIPETPRKRIRCAAFVP